MYSTKDLKDFIKLSGYNRNPLVLESALITKGFNQEKIDILLNYFDLIKNTNILNGISYDFYIKHLTYRDLERKYGKNKSQIANSIQRNTTKFFDILGSDIYETVRIETNIRKLNFYNNLINDLKVQFKTNKDTALLDKLIVNLDNYFPPIIEERPDISEQDIVEISRKFNILSDKYFRLLVDNANSEHLGYIKFLLETPEDYLDNQDVEFKNLLVSRLMLN